MDCARDDADDLVVAAVRVVRIDGAVYADLTDVVDLMDLAVYADLADVVDLAEPTDVLELYLPGVL